LKIIIKKYEIPARVPPYLFNNFLSDKDRVIVILEHIDYLLRLRGKKSTFAYAAYNISKIKGPIASKIDNLRNIKSVGPKIEGLIKEIIETKTSKEYERLIYWKKK
jgi:DNA polymerase/3'-5' exonuclease PolX